MSRKPHQFGKTTAAAPAKSRQGETSPAAAYRVARANRASEDAAEADGTRQAIKLGFYCGGGMLAVLVFVGIAANRLMG